MNTNNTDRPADLIETNKAAKLLNTHPNTIRRWIFTGKIKGWRLMRRYYVSQSELLDLMQPATHRPNGDPCERQKCGRKPTKEAKETKEWVDSVLREYGLAD